MTYSKQTRISGPAANGDYAIVEPGGIIVGEAFRRVGEDGWRDAEANARLWAKAPDLRAALGRCIRALRKWEAHLEVSDPTLERDEVIEAIQQARAALGEEAGE